MRKFIDRIKGFFVEGSKEWYKLWSSWLAIAQSILVTMLWTDPRILSDIFNVLPSETRYYMSPVILGLAAALPIIVRLLKQKKITTQ